MVQYRGGGGGAQLRVKACHSRLGKYWQIWIEELPKEIVADKELSALLARNQLVPIVHNTTYDALRNVSPLLASRTGLDTAEDSMANVAVKIAELVAP